MLANLAIVILNWNGAKDTIECLKSLADIRHARTTLLVVDNGSSDDSVNRLKKLKSEISFELIETGKNLGFAEGNNVGMRMAIQLGAEFILLLNNDTIVDPEFATAFIQAAYANPEAAVFSGKIYYFSNPKLIWYAGATWQDRTKHFQHIGFNEFDSDLKYQKITDTDYASGCAFFIRASSLARIGLLDEKFFLTYEESDFCYRAKSLGFRILFVPEAKIWHKVSVSFGGVDSPLQLYFYSRNILLWAERHLPRRDYWDLFFKTACEALHVDMSSKKNTPFIRWIIWSLASFLKHTRRNGSDSIGRARYLGFRDYLLRRFGDCPDEVRALKTVPPIPTQT